MASSKNRENQLECEKLKKIHMDIYDQGSMTATIPDLEIRIWGRDI